MLTNFRDLGYNMNINVHYLYCHLGRFPENLGNTSDEEGERFHQKLKIMEDRYQGRKDIPMMVNYCWNLQRECTNKTHSNVSNKRSFQGYIK